MNLGTPRYGDFGRRRIHWRRQDGDGPPVVFLNGCAMAAHHWRRVIRRLPERELICFDRPGMAGTPWPGESPTLAAEVATLVDLMGVASGPAVLVAHSMAAFHAEALARQHPALVSGLILVDPSAVWAVHDPGPGPVAPARWVRELASNPPLDWTGYVAYRIGAWAQSQRQRTGALTERFRERLTHLYRSPDALAMGVAEFFAYASQAWELMAVRATAPMARVPGEILTADLGEELPDDHVRLGRLLGLPSRRIAHSRHLMMMDRPDAIAAAIRAAV